MIMPFSIWPTLLPNKSKKRPKSIFWLVWEWLFWPPTKSITSQNWWSSQCWDPWLILLTNGFINSWLSSTKGTSRLTTKLSTMLSPEMYFFIYSAQIGRKQKIAGTKNSSDGLPRNGIQSPKIEPCCHIWHPCERLFHRERACRVHGDESSFSKPGKCADRSTGRDCVDYLGCSQGIRELKNWDHAIKVLRMGNRSRGSQEFHYLE